ncbi:HrcA family transcriptional regulator [Patescibacteria group bacterium]
MTDRQKSILGAIVKEYTESACPVGSKVLADKYGFKLSPATIRNEMKFLEKAGYITQPHTSAGRVPIAKGYRFFVDTLMQYVDLAKRDQLRLEKKLRSIRAGYDKILKESASLMAQMSGNVALAEAEEEQAFCTGIANILQQPEFASVEKACKMAEVFERLSDEVAKLDDEKSTTQEVAVYIGSETPLTKELDCSLLISKYRLPSGEDGHVAILGPTRMKYEENISLIKYLTGLLKNNFFPVIIIISVAEGILLLTPSW